MERLEDILAVVVRNIRTRVDFIVDQEDWKYLAPYFARPSNPAHSNGIDTGRPCSGDVGGNHGH